MITAVVHVNGGVLESVRLFEDRDEALRYGKEQWLSHSRRNEGEMMEDDDFDERWGGVARGYIMHWFTDEDDVWVVEPEETGDFSMLSPEMIAALGRHTIEAAAEEVLMAEQSCGLTEGCALVAGHDGACRVAARYQGRTQ